MQTLRNLTLHEQSDLEVNLAASQGFALTPEPGGVEVEIGNDGLWRATASLTIRLRECRDRGEAILVGGHTGLWLAAVLHLALNGETLPPMYYFDTRRIRDDTGRFQFVPERLVRVQW
jgi:hypothetical protein